MKRISIFIFVCLLIITACSRKSNVPSIEMVQTVVALTNEAQPTATYTITPIPIPVIVSTPTADIINTKASTATEVITKSIASSAIPSPSPTIIPLTETAIALTSFLTATKEKEIANTATQKTFVYLSTEIPQYNAFPWRVLKSYPEDYLDQKIILEGKIVEVNAPKNMIKIEVETHDWVDITMKQPFKDIYIDDEVKVYGVWCGSGALRITWCMKDAFYLFK